MAEEISVPPEVLETFLKIKQLVDAMVDHLQALPPLQLSASGTGASTGTAPITVVEMPAVHVRVRTPSPSVSVTARPEAVRGEASVPTPTVTVTDEEVEVARKWVLATSAAVSAAATMAFFSDLEGLLQFIDRMRNLIP